VDPEQIYQEVLQEEQGKGVSSAVAEGRAKAARARAELGSPHPKEPKWWPGAQPHLEGGGEAAEEEAAAPAEAEVAEEPAAEEPAAEEPAAEAAEEPAAEEPAAEAPAAEAPAAEAAEAPAAEAAAPATATQLPPEQRPPGVTHGTTTGTRLRPEDEATTEAQFAGQQAMYDRRKLIDELVATGVPAVTAADTGRARAPFLVLLYLLIPLVAIAILVSQDEESEAEPPPPSNGGSAIHVTAENVVFDTDTITLPANEEAPIEFENKDSVQHNIAIYPDDGAEVDEALFVGELITTSTVTYEVPPQKPGEYFFQCDIHPTSMTGTAVVE
jgi:plastocyanin